jgi:drug/metabolite transporter (DMT)-like permease
MYYLSIMIASLSGVLYHVSQKSIHPKANPMISMMITFSVALIGTFIWYIIDGSSSTWITDVKNTNWASFSLGMSLVGLEFGILLAYRSGWQISNFNLFYTFLLAALLLPIGLLLFKETLSLKTVIGMGITVGGIALMKI